MTHTIRTLRAAGPSLMLLALAGAAQGAVLTAGPGGTYATVQDALDAAVALPGDDEVRVRFGVFPENLFVDLDGSGDLIEMSGGWDATFTSASDARTTVIDGGGLGKVFEIQTEGSDRFVLHGMELANGEDTLRAGVAVFARDTSSVELYNLTIRDNLAIADRASSGGLYAVLIGSADLEVRDCDLLDNTVTSTGTVDGRGGGLTVELNNTSTARIIGNRIRDNVVTVAGSGAGLGAGADIIQFEAGSFFELTDNEFRGNRIDASGVTGTGLMLSGTNWVARRNRVANNIDDSANGFGSQAFFSTFAGTAVLSDTLVVDGNARGVQLNANSGATLRATNLTVAGHFTERGILAGTSGGGQLSVYNSISVNNGVNAQLDPTVTEGSNLFTNDSGLFIDPLIGDYRLAPGSAAIDAGDNTPPGGLGPIDLAGRTRIFGPAVDIGAYEADDVLFADGFEA
ncbi:choice-of-anchor Q domain-containing protein [Halomonas denitrificans]|nr:right-handed parallel beta-helix repeat-containing protein [Halomonas denitrificans]